MLFNIITYLYAMSYHTINYLIKSNENYIYYLLKSVVLRLCTL